MANAAYINNEMQPFIVYGPYGYGKTSYAIKFLAEVYGKYNPQGMCIEPNYDWIEIKKHIYFHPTDFLAKLLSMAGKENRERAIVFDDAGVALSSYSWHDKFVATFAKYLNVVRTHFNCVMFTSPDPVCIIKRVRGMPQLITIKIYKSNSGNVPSHRWLRQAQGYRWWKLPDGKKSGVKPIFMDKFSAKLPDDLYVQYMEMRRDYADYAVLMMKKELELCEKHGVTEANSTRPMDFIPSISQKIGEETNIP